MPKKIFRITEEQKSYIKFMYEYQSMEPDQIRVHESMKKGDGSYHRLSTINLWINRLKETGKMENQPKSGRPNKINPSETADLIKFIKNNSHMRYPEVRSQTKLNISPRTVNRIANNHGIRTYKVVKRPILSEQNKRKRMILGTNLLKRPDIISKLVFTDEKKFMNKDESNAHYVNREKSKSYEAINLRFDCVGSSSADVNIWGCIGPFGKGI